MVEGPSPSGGIFPGILPAAINEISELFAELGKPTIVTEAWEYNSKGLPTKHKVINLSKLDLLLIVGGPTFLALFYVLIERLAAQGGDLSPRDAAAFAVAGPAGLALRKGLEAFQDKSLAERGNILVRLWSAATGISVGNPFD